MELLKASFQEIGVIWLTVGSVRELGHHSDRRSWSLLLPEQRVSAVTDFGQKQASCLFHGLALNHCQTFRKRENGLVAFVKLRPYLSSQGWLATGNERLHGAIPLLQPPGIWFRAWLCAHGPTWGGLSAVFLCNVGGQPWFGQSFQALRCHSILVGRTSVLAKYFES